MTTPTVEPHPDVARRSRALADLYNTWPSEGDPDDDPAFVRRAREIMGLPPLEPR